jgi:molybdopterin molybdotransferase
MMALIEIDDALEILATEVRPLASCLKDTRLAVGMVLARDVTAIESIPPFDTSAMDGYAIPVAQQPGALKVAFEVAAGNDTQALPADRAVRVFTGAKIPFGTASVVAQEDVAQRPDGVIEVPSVPLGAHIRRAGEIFRRGETIAGAGESTTPASAALWIAAGVSEVSVYRTPRLATVVTGSELLHSGDVVADGKIRDTNGPMLAGLIEDEGWELSLSLDAADDISSLCNALQRARREADMIVTSGGVSVGDYDLVHAALKELEAETVFHGVTMKPGKPVLVARLENAWVVGLPGNPVSAYCAWTLFARPLGLGLAGCPNPFGTVKFSCRLRNPAANPGKRTLMAPARWSLSDGVLTAEGCAWLGSHDVRALAELDGFIRIEPGRQYCAGDVVDFYPSSPRLRATSPRLLAAPDAARRHNPDTHVPSGEAVA